jgi:hypothetical protein
MRKNREHHCGAEFPTGEFVSFSRLEQRLGCHGNSNQLPGYLGWYLVNIDNIQ